MKKLITFFTCITIIAANSIFATTYLVQNGGVGDPTWRTPVAGETLIDLTVLGKTFNAWHADVVAGDAVWVIKGTYVLTASVTMKSGEQLYGGFSGIEVSVNDRVKGLKAWDFTNATTLDGNNACVIFNNSSALANPTLIDGFTVTKGKNVTVGYNMSGAGAKLNGNITMQNCIVSYCVSEYTSGIGGGGVGLNANSILKDSYVHHNTSATGKNAGGVYMFAGSTMSGCTIDSNAAPGNCGGVYMFNNSADGEAPKIENCTITNNTAGTGNGAGFMAYCSASNKKFTTKAVISGCTIMGNVASSVAGGGIYLNDAFSPNGYLFENCVIDNNSTVGNGGAIGINASLASNFNNCVISRNKGLDFVNSSLAAAAPTFQNCTFGMNKNVAGTSAVGMTLNNTTLASMLTNCIFYECSSTPITAGINPTVTYCGFESTVTLPTGTGNIGTIEAASFADAINGDYHLVSGSTAINSGTTIAEITTDIAGTSRPQGGVYDMGAYEYTIATSLILTNGLNSKVQLDQSTRTLNVESPIGTKLVIINSVGSIVKTISLQRDNMFVSTSNLSSGVYLVQLTFEGKRFVQKIIL